jgi:hypothetical protein
LSELTASRVQEPKTVQPGKQRKSKEDLDMNLRSKAGRMVIASVVTAISLGTMSSAATAQNRGLAAPIEGSWIFSVSGPVSFSALASFGAGGTWSATGALDHTAPRPNSTLFGTWRRIGDNQYSLTAYFFSFDGPTGAAAVMLKTNELFEMDSENNLHGVGDERVCDLSGQNCGPVLADIAITATRIIPEDAGLTLP